MKQWPHAPAHALDEQGAYMVTCGTYLKHHHLDTPDRLSLVQSWLLDVAEEFDWRLQAWAVLSNHYHFVASSPKDPASLPTMLSKLHTKTAIELNQQDACPERKVWYQYFETHLTYQKSYFARLKYVHHNAVHHGIVPQAQAYPWCSASWFAANARKSFYQTIERFKIDRVNVFDDFDVLPIAPDPS